MFFSNIWTDASKTAMAMMEASMENMRTTQQTMARQSEILSRMATPWSVTWSDTPLPIPVLSFRSEGLEASREAFRLMADANLNSWERAATAYAATPAWMKIPFKAPGDFWSRWFDQFQDGKYDTPFAAPATSVFDALIPKTTAPEKAANESQTETTGFRLESPAGEVADKQKPALLTQADGKADDLTQIKGIGPKLQKTLNDLGVFHLSQIAAWTPDNIAWLDERLTFKGRIHREGWVEQAQTLLQPAA
jgi:predicted flap endonuclease-1-like 5' DNA nuclease